MSSIRRIGDWDKVYTLVKGLDKEMRAAAMRCLQRWCLKSEALAKLHVSNQDLGWVPLSPRYLAEKVRENWSDQIYVRTSDYFQSITSWVDGGSFIKQDMVGYAGVKKEARNREGLVIADIAKTLEYGSQLRNIPERPLWRPVYQETVKWIGDNPGEHPDKVFLEAVKKYY